MNPLNHLHRRFVALFMGVGMSLLVVTAAGCGHPKTTWDGRPIVRVGSKAFVENVILGEIVRDMAADAGADAKHDSWLGDTSKPWNALKQGDIDAYVEYTGTLKRDILADEGLKTDADLRAWLEKNHLHMSQPLGFNNTYAIAMKRNLANDLGVRTIGNLKGKSAYGVRLGVDAAFLGRKSDGWDGLRDRYGLQEYDRDVREKALGAHDVDYPALQEGDFTAVDVYSTDAMVLDPDLDLVLLDDPAPAFFPRYEAVVLYRDDLGQRAPEVVTSMLKLEGTLSDQEMRELNARAQLGEKTPEAQVAADFLAKKLNVHVTLLIESRWQRLLTATWQHLFLVVVALALGIVTAVPLGVLAARWPPLGQVLLGAAGMVQAVPALALLVLMLIFFGLGATPAIAALYLYSLLPIMRNTYTGLRDIPLSVRESAEALGLSSFARLRLIELPMASRAILAGVKTAAVITVGNATLGGLIGAGGYGLTIVMGLNKNDWHLLLEGAVPAMLMALLAQGLFETTERFVVPKGLRLNPGGEAGRSPWRFLRFLAPMGLRLRPAR